MANWRLRRAIIDDCDALSDCIEAAYSTYASRLPDLPAVAEGIADDIANHRVWVVEIDRKIVGGIILIPKDGHLLLANVAVHPQSSGQGLGRALMQRAESDCLELGLSELRLNTHVNMPDNVSLYAHLGWQETGRIGKKLFMKKTL